MAGAVLGGCATGEAGPGDVLSGDLAAVDAMLPPGTQVDHLESCRPQFHYTPETGWMNDPNGLIRVGDTWHLFHQYIPGEYVINEMNWGHAISTDLLRWEYRPVALHTSETLGMAYSGSAILDVENVSGLCGDSTACVLAFFTHSLMLGGDQKQSLAYSVDGGMTFAEYEGNPIMPNPGIANFRDPKVFLYDGAAAQAVDNAGPVADKWVMALAQGRQVGFYTSGDLIEWQPMSVLDNDESWPGGVWECPDLFIMPVENEPGAYKWVLVVGVFDGAPWLGSGVQYIVGSFDGEAFTPDAGQSEPRWLDTGWDFYAAQSFSNVPADDGRRIIIAWMNNWRYALNIPAMPWQGTMTFPRQLSLLRDGDAGYRLLQAPVDELATLRRGVAIDMTDVIVPQLAGQDPADPPLPGHMFLYRSETGLFEIDVTGPRDKDWRVQIGTSGAASSDTEGMVTGSASAMPGHQHAAQIGIEEGYLFIDRGNALCDGCPSGMGRHYSSELASARPADDTGGAPETVTVKILVDRSSVEVFADNGRVTMTALAFLPGPSWDITLQTFASSPADVVQFSEVKVTELFSIWADPE